MALQNLPVSTKPRAKKSASQVRRVKRSRMGAWLFDLLKPRKAKKIHMRKPREMQEHEVLRHLACTCSIVALHAELAKLKGHLSAEAFLEFRCLFPIGDAESKNLRYLFKLAWEDNATREHHIRYILQHFPTQKHLYEKMVEGLARQMLAENKPSKAEITWLQEVAADFGITRLSMHRIFERAEKPLEASPYVLFNLPKKATHEQVKQAYRSMMLKCHPDKVSQAILPETRAAATKLSTAATIAYRQLNKRRLHG